MELHGEALRDAFESVSEDRRVSRRLGLVDRTAKLKDVMSFLTTCGWIAGEADRKTVGAIIEKSFDPICASAHVDVLIKEQEKEDREKERRDTKDKKKKLTASKLTD